MVYSEKRTASSNYYDSCDYKPDFFDRDNCREHNSVKKIYSQYYCGQR